MSCRGCKINPRTTGKPCGYGFKCGIDNGNPYWIPEADNSILIKELEKFIENSDKNEAVGLASALLCTLQDEEVRYG